VAVPLPERIAGAGERIQQCQSLQRSHTEGRALLQVRRQGGGGRMLGRRANRCVGLPWCCHPSSLRFKVLQRRQLCCRCLAVQNSS
jgi:hypothetical protein